MQHKKGLQRSLIAGLFARKRYCQTFDKREKIEKLYASFKYLRKWIL